MSFKAEIIGLAEASDFRCIGGECSDTCCAGWKIPVDIVTLGRWQKSPHFCEISPKLDLFEKESVSPVIDEMGAVLLTTDPGSRCSFLDSDNLCSMQKEYGHEFLSVVCKDFPRERKKIYHLVEESLNLSCPEAARLILGSEHGLSIQIQTKDSEDLQAINLKESESPPWRTIPESDGWILRTWFLTEIQKRDRTLRVRLGRFLYLSAFIEDNEFLLRDSKEQSASDKLRILETTISGLSEEDGLWIFRRIVDEMLSPGRLLHFRRGFNALGGDGYRIKEMFDFCIGIDDKTWLTTVVESFAFMPILHDEWSNVFENFVFSRLYSLAFPIGCSRSREAMVEITFILLIINVFIAQKARFLQRRLELDECIEVFQVFYRWYGHSEEIKRQCSGVFEGVAKEIGL